jgi:hypothetical protein
MMPQLVTLRVRHPRRRPVRLWIPIVPVVLVFAPVLILALPVATIASSAYRINPVRALGAGWRLLCALPGTQVDVRQGRAAVLVTIR